MTGLLPKIAYLLPLALFACASPGEPDSSGEPERQASKGFPKVYGETTCTPTGSTVVPLDVNRFVFAVDRSSAVASQWANVASGMNGFFANANSSGIQASLHLFPSNDTAAACEGTTYAAAHVPSYPLPDDAIFSRVLLAAKTNGLATPRAALIGALADAKQQATESGTVPEVVFVTSGPSSACNEKGSWEGLRAEAESAFKGSPSIRVHLLTIGDFGAAANAVALAGGTESAVVISGSNVSDLLRAEIAKIATPPARCDVSLPEALQNLDVAMSSLFIGTTRSKESYTAYNPTCEGGVGFRLDSVEHPTKIEFCALSCNAARDELAFRINTGCKTGTDAITSEPTSDGTFSPN